MLIDYKLDMNKLVNKLFLLFMSILFIPFSIKANVYCFTGTLLCLQIVPMAMFYYVLGNILCHYTIKISEERTIMKSIVFISLASMTVVLANLNSTVMMYKNEYGNLPLFFITSISGCFLTIYVSTYIKDSILLKYIGRKCVAFYVWQFLVVSLCISVASRGIKMIPNVENDNIITFMAFSMALPISYIIVKTTQKHIPGIYGYKR